MTRPVGPSYTSNHVHHKSRQSLHCSALHLQLKIMQGFMKRLQAFYLLAQVLKSYLIFKASDQHKMFLQVMERVLHNLRAQHNSEPSDPKVGVVRLTGLAHTEEVAAFKHIAHQLCGCAVP